MLDPEFIADCPYAPGGLLLDEVLNVDRENSFVSARMPTHDDLPLTREQRAHPLYHPRHVSGGLMVHMTGIIGYVHAYYVLDIRHKEGWVGYGGRIHGCRFKALAPPGKPLVLECKAKQMRRTPERILARYDIRLLQGETLVYEGDQTAFWMKVAPETAAS